MRGTGLAGVGLSFLEICANPELGASFGISEQQQPVVIGQEMRQEARGSDDDFQWFSSQQATPKSHSAARLKTSFSLVVKDNEFAA